MYNIVTSLVCLYWAVCVSPVLSTSHVLGSFNPPVSPMRFYFYPQFAGEETNTSQSYNQTVLAEGLEPRRLAALHSLLATHKNSEHQTWHPEASASGSARPAAALRVVCCSPRSVASNLSFETCLGLQSATTSTFNMPFLLSAFRVLTPYCVKISWLPQDTLLCLLRGAPYFWHLVKEFIFPYPRGCSVCLFLALCCFWSLRNENVWKRQQWHFWPLLLRAQDIVSQLCSGWWDPWNPPLLWKWTSAFICFIYLDFTWSFIWKRVLFLKTFENHWRVRTYLQLPKRYWAISLFPPDPNPCKAPRTQAGHRSDGEGRFHLNHPVSPLSFHLTFHHHKEHFYPKDRLTPWSDLDSA